MKPKEGIKDRHYNNLLLKQLAGTFKFIAMQMCVNINSNYYFQNITNIMSLQAASEMLIIN